MEKSKSHICLFLVLRFLCFQMGNASENFLLVSNISKDNDIIMGTLYAILGELLGLLSPARLLRFPLNVLTSASLSPRCAVGAGEWNPSPCGLQEEVLPEAGRVFRG